MEEKSWFVYLIECLDGTYYTGITKDIEKRMMVHLSGKGSKYIKAHGFNKILFSRKCKDRSDALKKEYEIKQLSRREKVEWFSFGVEDEEIRRK